jgi:hypothetical protein
MATMDEPRRGIYISYNEEDENNGLIDSAVDISNKNGFLIWLETSIIKIENFVLVRNILHLTNPIT